MANRQILLISSSVVHGQGFLEHSKSVINEILNRNQVKEVTFVPYAIANKNYDEYTSRVSKVLSTCGFSTRGIHTFDNPINAVNSAECIFVGGGNTFLLLKILYDLSLIEPIRKRVLETSMPYIGSSAGTNVATVSIQTTNSMPIICPPSLTALNLVPFNINPHYPNGTHKDEIRERRIKAFHDWNDNPVLGLRDGTSVLIDGIKATLNGTFNARLFLKSKEPVELTPGSDLSWLL